MLFYLSLTAGPEVCCAGFIISNLLGQRSKRRSARLQDSSSPGYMVPKLGNVNESSAAKSSVHSTELVCLYQIKLLTSEFQILLVSVPIEKLFLN